MARFLRCRRASNWWMEVLGDVNITDLIEVEFKYRHKPTETSSSADNTENPGIGFDSIIGLERSQSRLVTGFVYVDCLCRLKTHHCEPPCILAAMFTVSTDWHPRANRPSCLRGTESGRLRSNLDNNGSKMRVLKIYEVHCEALRDFLMTRQIENYWRYTIL